MHYYLGACQNSSDIEFITHQCNDNLACNVDQQTKSQMFNLLQLILIHNLPYS